MKFVLKWVAIFVAYLTITFGIYALDPAFTLAQGWASAVLCCAFAVISVVLAITSTRRAKAFYRRGLKSYEEASLAYLNSIHGRYRTMPAGDDGMLKLICGCREEIGVFPGDKGDELIPLAEKHVKTKLAEIAVTLREQRETLWEVVDRGEVKHDSAV